VSRARRWHVEAPPARRAAPEQALVSGPQSPPRRPGGVPPSWSIVVPVKLLRLAKSRLAVESGLRPDLVLAMALDTTAAALACARVAQVVVVSDDPRASGQLRGLGATVVRDEPDAGLNPALAHGIAVAREHEPDAGVATMSADLPALRPAELARALDAAAGHPRAMVPDAELRGTTLLTARPGVDLVPAYGADSRARHVRLGHAVVDVSGIESVRRDVDTLADLWAAARLGAGPRTSALLPLVGADSP
jgi:2-phospho-L-lactate guanylyltransferase